MDLSAIKNNLIEFSSTAFNETKVAVVWLGHNIQIGFTDYIIPRVQSLWAKAVPMIITLKNMIAAGQCSPLLIAAVLFITGIAAFKIVDRKAYEDNIFAMKAWTTVGILSFIGMTVFTSYGIAPTIIG